MQQLMVQAQKWQFMFWIFDAQFRRKKIGILFFSLSHASILYLPNISELGEPRISVSPRKPITGVKGADISFECHASIDLQDKVSNMTVYWKTGNNTHLVPIPQQIKRAKIEFRREMKGVSLLLQTRLTLHDLDEDSVGSYFCVGDVQVMTARNTFVTSGTLMNKVVELQKG